jgi:hypothetical protein
MPALPGLALLVGEQLGDLVDLSEEDVHGSGAWRARSSSDSAAQNGCTSATSSTMP